MTTINISEIEQDFAGYLSRLPAGEVVVIVSNGHPIAEIKSVATTTTTQRPFGLAAGEFRVPDDFNDPLPIDVLQQFEAS